MRKIVVKLVGTILVIWILSTLVDFDLIKSTLSRCDRQSILNATILTLICPVIISTRLLLFVKLFNSDCTFYSCIKTSLSGLSLNLFIPARGGDFIKIIYLKQGTKNSWGNLINAAIWERVFDVFAILFLGILGSILIKNLILTLLFTSIVIMVFFVFFLLNKFGDRVFRNSKFQSVLHSSNQIYSNFSLSILAFLNCLVCWSFNVCIMGNLLRAVDPNMSFLHSLYATPPSILGGILPISLWGIGTRDGIFAYCLQQFTAPENSISAGFLYTVHVYWLLGILGIPFLFFATKLKRSLKEESR